ncbi:hypothetical protein D3C79_774390 [compost metagenome]
MGVGDAIEQAIEQRGAAALEVAITGAVPAFGQNHVGAVLPFINQLRNHRHRVLQVNVHGHHGVTAGVLQAGEQGRLLAKVTREVDQHHVAVGQGDGAGDLGRAIAAAIVDEHDFDEVGLQRGFLPHRLVKPPDGLLFVEHWHDQ